MPAEDTAVTDPSHDATDDGFHEIQLSGKQLVFLFMATTVVSVVIFLCGVLVGRGVRGEALSAADRAATPLSTGGANLSAANTPPPAPVDPPAPAEDRPLTYKDRLDGDKAVPETLKPRSEPEPAVTPDAPKTTPVESPAPRPEKTSAETQPRPTLTPAAPVSPAPKMQSPQRGVWAVQVVALTDRAAATAVVQRLHAKGYPAFLVSPQSGAPVQNYKVQVGRFEDRSQAEQIAGRLKKEEQFQPWILR